MAETPRPLLVTGAHRSGTTWVGKMLAAGGDYAYISEPLNVHHRPGIFNASIERWYTYISPANQESYLPAITDTLGLRYQYGAETRSLRSLKDIIRMGRDAGRFLQGRWGHRQPLLKDPFAVFSAPWFAEQLDCQVVITVRHPAAVISSLKRLGWSFNFRDLLAQPLLMEGWLGEFTAEMETAQNGPPDVIARGSLLWRIIYHVVHQYQEKALPFIVVRHEDLSLDPLGQFQAIYEQLGITFSSQAESRIRKATQSNNPAEVSTRSAYSVNVDSKANLLNWRKRLSKDEISRIRDLTGDIARHYYSEEDWL